MLKRIFFATILISFIIVANSSVKAQQKSFERKTKKQIEKKEPMDMNKCMNIIAANTEMRNEMLNKISVEFEKDNSVSIELDNIRAILPLINKEELKNDKTNKNKPLLLKKLPVKKK